MNKPGFFLTETIIYVALFSLLIALILPAVMHDASMLSERRNSLQYRAQMHAALECFVRDIQKAPQEKKWWPLYQQDQLVWQHKEESISWLVQKGALIRRKGLYNTKKNIWKKKTQSLAAHSIKSVTFDVEQKKNCITAIKITLESDKSVCCSRYVTLRNRII